MVGILLSYWGGLFSRAMLVSGRVSLRQINRPFFPSWLKWPFHFSWLRVSRLLWQGFFRSIMKTHAHQNILWTSLDAIQQKRCSTWPRLLTFGQKKLFLKNISQIGSSPQVGLKMQNLWNHDWEIHPHPFFETNPKNQNHLPKIWCSCQFPSNNLNGTLPTDP